MAVDELKADLADLRKKLQVYETQQEKIVAEMKSQLTIEVAAVATGLRELYEKVGTTVQQMEHRLVSLEKRDGTKGHRSLISAKHMTPEKLTKPEEWRNWKSDVEDYCEEQFSGMKEILDKVKKSEEEINEAWFDPTEEEWWQKGEMLWRFLKRYTTSESKKVIQGVREDNGWEAWRKLNMQFEPGLVVREAQVMAQFKNMVSRRAKNAMETKALMVELEERAKRVEEITGERVDARHAMSVIVGIMDTETLKHTAQFQGAKADVDTLKRKVMEFTNLMTSNRSADAMDLGRVQQSSGEDWSCGVCGDMTGGEGSGAEDEEEPEQLNPFNGRCHNCGGMGHFARECPSKPAGKGGSKGEKGKGPKGNKVIKAKEEIHGAAED